MWSEVNKKREFCILGTRFFLSLFCLERVTMDLRKIPQSGDMSHRGFYQDFLDI